MAFKYQPFPLVFAGVNLKSAPDALQQGECRRALNVRPAIDYGLSPRQGTVTFGTNPVADLNVHTARYLNDPAIGNTLYWEGAGTHLYNTKTQALLDSGYSGYPLTEVDYRLGGTSAAYAIIGDFNQMRKLASDGAAYQLGITPDADAAISDVLALQTDTIDTFAVDSGYTYSGVASHGVVSGSLQIVTNAGPGFATVAHASVVDLSVVGLLPSLNSDLFNLTITVDDPTKIQAIEIQILTGGSDYFITILEAPALTPGAGSQTNVQIAKSQFFGTPGANWANAASYNVDFYIAASAVATISLNAFYLSGGAGPNSSVGVGYDYRCTNYDQFTLSESNPSPIQGSEVYPVVQPVGLTPADFPTDPQVTQKRWWRRGGTLPDAWRLVGAQPNTGPLPIAASPAGLSLVTHAGKSALQVVLTTVPFLGMGSALYITGATDSTYDGFYPIVGTAGLLTFFCTPIGIPALTAASGGGTAQAAFVDTNTDTAIASAQELSLFNDVPITTVDPHTGETIYGQPLAFIWGPYSGTTIFGCGDPNAPGYLYWCNPSNPDGWSSINNIEVTQPSDPLQNGFFWNGAAYVFSKEKLFQMQPTPVGGSLLTYFPVDMVVGTGLYARWAIAASPHTPAVWFLGKDGVYEWIGGPAQLISDKLWPLFHDQTVEGNAPIDLTKESNIKMGYYDGELRLTFIDTAGNNQVWICDILHGHRWRQAAYPWTVLDIYPQPEVGNWLLMGAADANVYFESQQATVTSDGKGATTQPIACDIRTMSWNGGDARAEKVYGDFGVDLDTQGVAVSVTPGFNYFVSSPPATQFSLVGRTTYQVDINAGAGQLAFTAGLDFSWSSATATPVVYGWSPSLVLRPENTILRYTDPENCGIFGNKHFRSAIIEADTMGQTRSIQIQTDSGPNGAFVNRNSPLQVCHNGQSEIAYSFFPFQGHLVRVAPLDSNPWRLFGIKWGVDPYPEDAAIYGEWTDAGVPGAKFVQGVVLQANSEGQNVTIQVQSDNATIAETFVANHPGRSEIAYPRAAGDWLPFTATLLRLVPTSPIEIFSARFIFSRLPELATRWRAFPTTHGLPGYQSIFLIYVPHISTADLQLNLTPDIGPPISLTIPNSGGVFAKNLVLVPANKFKSVQYEITSAQPARIFLNSVEVHVRPWIGDDVIRQPFGDIAEQPTAAI